jgi:hypothetical protein
VRCDLYTARALGYRQDLNRNWKFLRAVVAGLALALVGVLAAPAAALATGSISGLVTDGADPLAGIEVCASEVPEEEEFRCAETDSSGEYTIAGLAADSYKVEFWPGPLNFVPQYFDARSSWALADQVVVTNGNDTPNVNAVLEEGGWIEGRAVDAVSKAGIGGLTVCAFPIDETGFGRCALTDSSGDYEIPGLATDAYEVAFFPEEEATSEYLVQFYKGKTSFFEATPVSVTAGAGTSGIGAEMKKGGQITGTVSDAASAAGIKASTVCLLPASEPEVIGCTFTGGSGGYSIVGLPPGAYKVWFSPDGTKSEEIEDDYFQQFYNAKPTFAQADAVNVSAGGVASGIDAHLVSRKAPPVVRPPATTLTAPPPKPRPKPHCRKGQRKVKRKGKFHCVKVHHRKKHHRHHGHGRLYRPAAHRSLLP